MPRKHPAKLSIFKSHSFYVRILTVFISLLLLTALPIIVYNYSENEHAVLELSDDLMNQVSKTVMEKAGNYFRPAAVMVEMGSTLVRLGAIYFNDHSEIESYALGVLKYSPQISMFFLADEQGNYIRAWRQPDGTMESWLIRPNLSRTKDTFRYWSPEFELLKTHEADTIGFDPRTRPWYVGARQTRSHFWTDVYISFRNKQPAITSSYPVFGEDGGVIGVWGVDIELDTMSDFLKTLKIGRTGIAFILNEKNQVVAFPGGDNSIKEEDGELRPMQIEELGIDAAVAGFHQHTATGAGKTVVESGGKRYFVTFSAFHKAFPVPLKIVMVVPVDDFIGGARQIMEETLFICLIILIISIFIAVLVSRDITRPIQLLAGETIKIRDFHLDGKASIGSYIKEIQLMSDAISAMKTGLKAFKRYVPAELVRQLIHTGEEARLGGYKKELTVFFSDIAGFTSIAEGMTPEELMHHLSEYFDELTKIIIEHHGTVDKYIGDAILAFWGAPIPRDDHAYRACAAALACHGKSIELNEKWKSEGKSPFHTRMGISTGETLVGNVGSSERINYTVMGDNVNLASRLEGANKFYQTGIIVSHSTYEATSDKFRFRLLGIVAAKGKRNKTAVYELIGRKSEDHTAEGSESAKFCEDFTRGVESYLAGEWDAACAIFTDLSARFPSDHPTQLYLSRCKHYKDHPPDSGWRGVEHLESK